MKHMEQEDEREPTIPTTASMLTHPLADWNELKNRFIMNGNCGEALKIMVEYEEEVKP